MHLWKFKLKSIMYRKYFHLCWMEKCLGGFKIAS